MRLDTLGTRAASRHKPGPGFAIPTRQAMPGPDRGCFLAAPRTDSEPVTEHAVVLIRHGMRHYSAEATLVESRSRATSLGALTPCVQRVEYKYRGRSRYSRRGS